MEGRMGNSDSVDYRDVHVSLLLFLLAATS